MVGYAAFTSGLTSGLLEAVALNVTASHVLNVGLSKVLPSKNFMRNNCARVSSSCASVSSLYSVIGITLSLLTDVRMAERDLEASAMTLALLAPGLRATAGALPVSLSVRSLPARYS